MNLLDAGSVEAPRRLAFFAVQRPGFRFTSGFPRHVHLGALLADGILQAGLNYKTVVFPRVAKIERSYPQASIMSGLLEVLDNVGVSVFLDWQHHEKIRRFSSLVNFLRHDVESVEQFSVCITREEIQAGIHNIHGIGAKTVDYLCRLAGGAEIAVDRHVVRFVESAGIRHASYASTKKVVGAAADFLGVSHDVFDASIWSYMSGGGNEESNGRRLQRLSSS